MKKEESKEVVISRVVDGDIEKTEYERVYQVGSKNQHESLIKTHRIHEVYVGPDEEISREEYMALKELATNGQGVPVILEKTDEPDEIIEILESYKNFFSTFLEARDLSHDVNDIHLVTKNAAEKGLTAIDNALNGYDKKNCQFALLEVLKAAHFKELLVIAGMEPRYHAGKTKTTQAHEERSRIKQDKSEIIKSEYQALLQKNKRLSNNDAAKKISETHKNEKGYSERTIRSVLSALK